MIAAYICRNVFLLRQKWSTAILNSIKHNIHLSRIRCDMWCHWRVFRETAVHFLPLRPPQHCLPSDQPNVTVGAVTQPRHSQGSSRILVPMFYNSDNCRRCEPFRLAILLTAIEEKCQTRLDLAYFCYAIALYMSL